MGRPEWILIAVILSIGLLGSASAVVGLGVSSPGAGHLSGTIGPADDTNADTEWAENEGRDDTAESADDAESPIGAPETLGGQDRRFLAPPQQEFERSTFRVHVDADANARWQFRYERPIESDDERSGFRSYAEQFRTEETDFYRDFRNRSSELTTVASAETGRSMTARNVTRDAGIDQTPTREEGYVELSFDWTNFGQVDSGSVEVGDVFRGGLYLGETQSLIFLTGEGVRFDSVEPSGSSSGEHLSESQSVTWTGKLQFADRHPRAAFQIDGTGSDADAGASMLWLLGGGMIGLLLVAVIVIVRYGGVPSGPSRDEGAPTTTSTAATSTADAGDDTDDEPSDAGSAQAAPEEPIPDDRQVKRLLEDTGGRMKQTAIVEGTEWSKSKVSMLLSEMEEEDEIRKIQIGRENIIALEGHEPEAATSPFDDAE